MFWPKAIAGVDGELVIRLTGPDPFDTSIVLGAGGPIAMLAGTAAQLTWLGCGRGAPDREWLTGDETVIAAISSHLGFTP